MSIFGFGYSTPRIEEESESAEEVFEDASADMKNIDSDGQKPPSLEVSLKEVNHLLEIALDNRFQEALGLCEKWAHVSLYHALGKATLGFLKGVLTLEKKETEEAMNDLKELIEVYLQKRKNINPISKLVWKPNYNTFTDEEIHAELVYAEALLMISLMTFLGDQNLMNLVKGAFRIRSCFQSYKECNYILSQRSTWTCDSNRRHFESGVRMGIGTFNIMISHMPNKILKILEVFGFSGNRTVGFAELELATLMTDGLRSPLALLISMTYHCYVEHYFGVGEGDIGYVSNLLDKTLEKYPNSAFFLLFAGRVAQLQGHFDVALGHFDRCYNIQNEWKQLHNVCFWESLWCHALQCDWKSAAKYADLLRKQCNWSPATYTYQYATFLYMDYERDGCKDEELKAQIDELINSVPALRIRYAGKTVPCEKFAIVKSEKYYEEDPKGSLLMPALEFIYIWNMFAILDKTPQHAQKILDIVEANIGRYEPKDGDDESKARDRYALCLLLKGMSLRTLNYPLQAEEAFLKIIDNEKKLVTDTYIAPHASMELGITYMRKEEYSMAKIWLERARKEYTGYLLETLVHFRVHCALRTIKTKEREAQLTEFPDRSLSSSINESTDSSLEVGTDVTKSNLFSDMARQYQLERNGKEEGAQELLGL